MCGHIKSPPFFNEAQGLACLTSFGMCQRQCNEPDPFYSLPGILPATESPATSVSDYVNNLQDILWYATRHICWHAKRPDENDKSCKKHLHANPLCNHVDAQHSSVAVANYVLVFNIKVVLIGRSIVGLMCCEIPIRWIVFVQQ